MPHLSPPRIFVSVAALSLAAQLFAAGAWDRFRGPNGAGVSETEGLPVHFGPARNVVWKTELPQGKSSPVLTADRIYLTAHKEGTLFTVALDRASGKILWRQAAPSRRLEKMNSLNDEAAATPVTDGENVYVFFGGYGLLSYGPDGNLRWARPMGPFTNFHGMGASPILADGKVLMVCDQDRDAYVIALNQDDGKTAWKVERPEMVHSFSTPLIHRPANGPSELVVPGSYQMVSYAVDSGRELWRARGLTYQVKSTPVSAGGTVYFNGWAPGGMPSRRLILPDFDAMLASHDADKDGFLSKGEIPATWRPGNWEMQDLDKDDRFDRRDWFYYQSRRTSSNSTMAIRLGGRGDVSDTHVLWRHRKSLPDVPSVLLYRDVLYLVKSGGIVTTLDPLTGEILRQGRLPDAIDDYYASPVAADGKVYMISREGKVSVIEAGRKWKVSASNELGEEVFATPAIADGRLYIRTAGALYCFAKE